MRARTTCAWIGIGILVVGSRPGVAAGPDEGWISKIRKDHPRLFFNRDTWPAVKARALGPERDVYEAMKKRVDGYPDDPKGDSGGPAFDRDEVITGKTHKMKAIRDAKEWGPQAMQTAFVYLMTGDRTYLDKAVKMLKASIEVYHKCYQERRAVHWYSETRISALAAYDWLYNDLTPEQRRAILLPLLKHIDDVQPGKGKPPIYRINSSNHTTGFYGVKNIVWFAGLATHGDGLADETALRFLKLGYKYNQDLFGYRKMCAGDDGGLASATPAYAVGWYPLSQVNFLHSWRSAIGENIAPNWPHLAYFPIWIMWNWIPAPDAPKQFGTGDGYHKLNNLPAWSIWAHMTQIMHFYGRSHPNCAAVAAHIRTLCANKQFPATFSVYPFLMSDLGQASAPRDAGKIRLLARRFESLGQVIMRSGWGVDDTYCLFTIGSRVPSHKQYDENNFVIYKKGFVALDSGTRGSSKDFHLRHYYAQTVAHNCVLIHMPNEPFAPYWGPACKGPEGKTSYGGMNRTTGGKVAAFETNDRYVYVAGDATACYSDKKCKLALRQFLFVPPDHFVICDRVTSTRPEYKKAWLLHTQNEPKADGMQFRADEGSGRLFCRTLLPKDAALTKIGGPGKEFWANGVNWELNDAVKQQNERQKQKTGKAMLLGNWRVEVSPGQPRTDDVFLHLIQVGARSLAKMAPAELIERPKAVGLQFALGNRRVYAVFSTAGKPSGHIRIVDGARTTVDRDFTQRVMPQTGLGTGQANAAASASHVR